MLMLNILSASKSPEAYLLLKQFLMNDPPADADYETALTNFTKNPDLAAILFPDLAAKLKDESLTPIILELASLLIDSNKIQYNSIKAYEDDIVHYGKKLQRKYQDNNSETFYPPHTSAVIDMLAKINQKQSKAILNNLVDLQNYNLSALIIVALIKNNQTASAGLIDWFCKTPKRRIALYDDLVKIGKQSSFKGEYASQRSFADAFAIIYTDNEISESTPKFYDLTGIKDARVKDNVLRFYIYKVTCRFRRADETFTCIIGPFSTDPSNYSIPEGKELYILSRKEFDSNKTDKLFDDFIEQVKKVK
jgi:hypothetical protein